MCYKTLEFLTDALLTKTARTHLKTLRLGFEELEEGFSQKWGERLLEAIGELPSLTEFHFRLINSEQLIETWTFWKHLLQSIVCLKATLQQLLLQVNVRSIPYLETFGLSLPHQLSLNTFSRMQVLKT